MIDKRTPVVQCPVPAGWNTFAAGRDDDPGAVPPASPNGTGKPIFLSLGAPGEEAQRLSFVQPIYLNNGEIDFRGSWEAGDEWSFWVEIPATQFEASDEGDVVLVNAGGFGVWMPAESGKGTHLFDQKKAVPVPAGKNLELAGWNVDESNELVLPAPPGGGAWMLIDVPTQSYFFRSLPVPVSGQFRSMLTQSEWICSKWTATWAIKKTSAGPGTASGWLLTYRQDTR